MPRGTVPNFEHQFALGNLHGVRMNVSGLAISHVMFADDIMIFAKANRKEVEVVDDFLESYCQWSGQLINKGKSGLFFLKLVHRNCKHWILSSRCQGFHWMLSIWGPLCSRPSPRLKT